MNEDVIQIKGLKKFFRIRTGFLGLQTQWVRAVDDINLRISRGEIMGLVGESGSGKTTLARTILNLTQPTSGSVYLNGQNISQMNRRQQKQMRKEIAVVFQEPSGNLNPRHTVGQSIMRPMIIHGVPRKEAQERALEALNQVKLDPLYFNSFPTQLSGGQQQRVAIARALVLKPKLMVLDEPTSALDISVQAQVLNLLLDLQEQLGLTYLLITHDLSVIQYVCDRVAVMYLGKLVEYGDTMSVLHAPLHPYTQSLMSSLPKLDIQQRDAQKKLPMGDLSPLPHNFPGCRFQPRCPMAKTVCLEACPALEEANCGHFAACFMMHGKEECS